MVAWAFRKTKAVITAVIGFAVVGIGIAMIFLPGPAVVVIPVGLAILATEFDWARRLLSHVKERVGPYLKKRGRQFPKVWRVFGRSRYTVRNERMIHQ